MANWLDDKILRIFSAATIVIGFLGLSSVGNVEYGFQVKSLVLLLPLLPYLYTAVVTFRHVNPDRFHLALRADELSTDWKEGEEDVVRRALVKDREAFPKDGATRASLQSL
jgi:hypothetical protein